MEEPDHTKLAELRAHLNWSRGPNRRLGYQIIAALDPNSPDARKAKQLLDDQISPSLEFDAFDITATLDFALDFMRKHGLNSSWTIAHSENSTDTVRGNHHHYKVIINYGMETYVGSGWTPANSVIDAVIEAVISDYKSYFEEAFTLSKSYQKVFFEPWIGPEYETGGLHSRKVLIVGESHYNHWCEKAVEGEPLPPVVRHDLPRSITQECVQEVVDGERGARYWNSARNRIGGSNYEDKPSADFWNKVAFYNFVQSPVEGGPGARPTRAQWLEAAECLPEALEIIRPERVIFTGWKLWEHVQTRDGKLNSIERDGLKLPLEYFNLADGTRVFVTATAHPRTQYFVRALTPLLHEFINQDWTQVADSNDQQWSSDLQNDTREALAGISFIQLRDGKLALKNVDGRFGMVAPTNISLANICVVDRSSGYEYNYTDADEAIKAGWAID